MTARSRFAAGQVWTYRTRPGEEDSRATVCAVDPSDRCGWIVHVRLSALRAGDGSEPFVLAHAPVSEEAFARSVLERTTEVADGSGFLEGYEAWKAQGGDSYFIVTLAELAAMVARPFS